jgi:hypothetical protein
VLIQHTTRVIVCCATSAGVYEVRSRFGRWSSRELAWVADLSDERSLDAARAAVMRVGRAGAIVAIADARSVHARPMAMSSAMFRSARAEVARSAESLLPIDASGASIGFVDRAQRSASAGTDDEAEASGYLLGIEAAEIRRVNEVCAALTGERPARVLAPHQVLACAGLQNDQRAIVRERGAFGDLQDTLLERGEIVELRRDADPAIEPAFTLPEDASETSRAAAGRLAIGAAVMDKASPGSAIALEGEWSANWKRAIPAGALLALACGLLWGAMTVRQQRYESAIEELRAEQRSLGAELSEVTAARTDLQRLKGQISSVASTTLTGRERVMEALDSVERALPPGAFLESLTVDAQGIRLQGIAESSREVLIAIEASDRLTGAREAERPQPTGDGTGREHFDVRVTLTDRVAGGQS